jgi:hypothetical protein
MLDNTIKVELEKIVGSNTLNMSLLLKISIKNVKSSVSKKYLNVK